MLLLVLSMTFPSVTSFIDKQTDKNGHQMGSASDARFMNSNGVRMGLHLR